MPGKRTVLVADDDKLIRTMMSDILADDYEVTLAEDGTQAVDHIKREAFDAVLSDQNMPGVAGVDVLRLCADLHADTARILVTATQDVKDLRDAVNVARVHHLVVKPVREVEMLEIVGGAIRECNLEAENRKLLRDLQIAVEELQARERELESELVVRTRELKEVVNSLRDKTSSED